MSLQAQSTPHAPLDLLERAATVPGELCYLFHRSADLELLGLGAAVVLEAQGPDRFARLDAAALQLLASLSTDPQTPAFAQPRLLGGFAFRDEADGWDDFGAARLVLPEVLLVRQGDQFWETRVLQPAQASRDRTNEPENLGVCPTPGGLPVLPRLTESGGESETDFCLRVQQALVDLESGAVQKLVLARSRSFEADQDLSPFALAASLRRSGSLIYLFRPASGAAFVGATPELLCRRVEDRVESCALAGTARRGSGALRGSDKDAREHELVAIAVREALQPVVELDQAAGPELMELSHLEHLRTPIAGTLKTQVSALDLAGRLHPTPAVAGAPKAESLEWLAKHEPLERGWYSGTIGWLEAGGNGEFWVALRCARIEGRRLHVYAGAGIVPGSDPRAEWAETALKLKTILSNFES